MVAMKLSELASKGWGWIHPSASGGAAATAATATTDTDTGSEASNATGSAASFKPISTSNTSAIVHRRPRSTSVASAADSDDGDDDYEDDAFSVPETAASSKRSSTTKYLGYAQEAVGNAYSTLSSYMASLGLKSSSSIQTSTGHDIHNTESGLTFDTMSNNSNSSQGGKPPSTSLLLSPAVLNLFHNPYVTVRRGQAHSRPTSSMDAIRSLIQAVPQHIDHTANSAEPQEYSDPLAGTNLLYPQKETMLRGNSMPSSTAVAAFPEPTDSYSSSPTNRMPIPRNLSERYPSTASHPFPSSSSNLAASSHQRLVQQRQHSSSEMASQLAEGTLRAFRDVALDEAVELHASLRYWSYRWEHPFLSWLEAGPWTYWNTGNGYDHAQVGQTVSQLQAVLARRLATIGDLQSHLLRAGWQRGVAQWGVLGGGGEWATVAGMDGRMKPTDPYFANYEANQWQEENEDDKHPPLAAAAAATASQAVHSSYPSVVDAFSLAPRVSSSPPPPPPPSLISKESHNSYSFRKSSSDTLELSPPLVPRPTEAAGHHEAMPPPPTVTSPHKMYPSQQKTPINTSQWYYTNVFVKKNDGGPIWMDDPALCEWSVDAMSLVRKSLMRAANGAIRLPYSENWADGEDGSWMGGGGDRYWPPTYDLPPSNPMTTSSSLIWDNPTDETAVTDETVVGTGAKLPLWASLQEVATIEEGSHGQQPDTATITDGDETEVTISPSRRVQISDLPLLVKEVSELLNIMDSVMKMQRARRLDRLKPPSWLRRNWYIGAFSLPPLLYFSFQATRNGYGLSFLKATAKQFGLFFREHVVEPILAIYEEFTKGTVDVSDREARNVAIKNLRKMIRSWLDETHPDMPVKERKRLAKAMDISLIEAEKEESMKTIYNINSVIRMSFIEAQFLKKEMMNALLAMDEMRAATNFNMNLAAVTPFVLLVWATQKVFKFVFYAILRMGKSREETYGSFFFILNEIERLLVMRDNPPSPPTHRQVGLESNPSQLFLGDSILNQDDLGMLMLHIHELRTVLWQDRGRFSTKMIQSVGEDLAELAGERGAVSVRQQLQIIARMCRTYPFLRNVNSRMFQYR